MIKITPRDRPYFTEHYFGHYYIFATYKCTCDLFLAEKHGSSKTVEALRVSKHTHHCYQLTPISNIVCELVCKARRCNSMRYRHPTPARRQREAAASGGDGAAPPAATLDAPPPTTFPLPAIYIQTKQMHAYKFLWTV